MRRWDEAGRTLLEMLAIVVIIVFLSLGGIKLYGMIMAQNEATVLHQDIVVRGRLNKEGIPKTKKMFDTGMAGKSRLKDRPIEYKEKADGYYYSYTVTNINKELCQLLATKHYDDADRVVINGTTYSLTEIETRNETETHKVIDGTAECLESNAIEVVFKKSSGTGAYIPRPCKTDDDCPSTRKCHDGVCQDTCENCKPDEICFQGECVPKWSCQKGNCCPQNCCDCDTDKDICTTCSEGYYLSDGKCIDCPDHAICLGCSPRTTFDCPANFEKDEANRKCTCPAGYKLDSVNKTCTACPAGTYSRDANSTSCTDCPCGTYNNETGKSSCTACTNGQYASGTKNTSCTATTGRDYVSPTNKCQKQTASACNKPNSDRTGEQPCSSSDTSCEAGAHKHPDGAGHCVCDTAGTQGDCPSGKIADGNCNCVGCINNGQCGTTQCDTNNGECCPTDKPYYDSTNKKCIACNGNYGSDATHACGETNPVCSNDVCTTCSSGINFNTNTHQCCDSTNKYYDSTNKKCFECDGNYGSDATHACGETNPVCSNDVCTTCSSGIDFNTNTHQCCDSTKPIFKNGTCNCPANTPYDNGTLGCGICVPGTQDQGCTNGFFCNADGNSCYCPAGYGLVNGVCSPCENNTISKANGYCVDCGAGTANDTHTDCNCYANAVHDADTLLCSCPQNYPYKGDNNKRCGICFEDHTGSAVDSGCNANAPYCVDNTEYQETGIILSNNAPTGWHNHASGDGGTHCVPCLFKTEVSGGYKCDVDQRSWVPCEAGETCGCPYGANGSGGCRECTQHDHCAAGKYCNNNKCENCGVGYACGCSWCSNGSGGCYDLEGWCRHNNGNFGAVGGDKCGKDTCQPANWNGSGWSKRCVTWGDCWKKKDANGNSYCNYYYSETPKSCTACTWGSACR